MSQRETVRIHLLEAGTLTQRQASMHYGIDRLAARIDELRGEGLDIITDMIAANGKRFARYRMGVE